MEISDKSPFEPTARFPENKTSLIPWALVGAGILLAGLGVASIILSRTQIPGQINFSANVMLGLGAGSTALGVALATTGVFAHMMHRNLKRRTANVPQERPLAVEAPAVMNLPSAPEPSLESPPTLSMNIPVAGTEAAVFRLAKEVPLQVVSFNVGSFMDWEALKARSHLKNHHNWDIAHQKDPHSSKAKITTHLATHKSPAHPYEEVQRKIESYLGSLISTLQPDILCLQKAWNDATIMRVLKSKGYIVVGEGDLGFAFKAEKFVLMSHQAEKTFDPNRTEINDCRYPLHSSCYIDLKHKESGLIIRAVSDRLKEFDASAQKAATARRRIAHAVKEPLSPDFAERKMKYLENMAHEYGEGPERGDAALDLSLHALDQAPQQAHVIIYGVDAHATQKEGPQANRLHPKRMRLFGYYAYQVAGTGTATHIDEHDLQSRKYHHIAAKASHQGIELNIQSQTTAGINDPALLTHPEKLMSPHLPAVARLVIRPMLA